MNLGPGITLDIIDLLIKSENISTDSNLQVLFKDPVNGNGLKPVPSEMEGDSKQYNTRDGEQQYLCLNM